MTSDVDYNFCQSIVCYKLMLIIVNIDAINECKPCNDLLVYNF